MSTVQRVNFEPVRDVLPIQRMNLPLADPTIADPLNAVALVDGEWMNLNTTGTALERATDITTPGAVTTGLSYPCWNERGRSDVLATGERRTVVLWLGAWEFDSRIYDAAAVVSGGLAITAVGQPLKVATITLGGRNYSGLVGHGGSPATGGTDTEPVVGYVTKLPANNGGKLRLRGGVSY